MIKHPQMNKRAAEPTPAGAVRGTSWTATRRASVPAPTARASSRSCLALEAASASMAKGIVVTPIPELG